MRYVPLHRQVSNGQPLELPEGFDIAEIESWLYNPMTEDHTFMLLLEEVTPEVELVQVAIRVPNAQGEPMDYVGPMPRALYEHMRVPFHDHEEIAVEPTESNVRMLMSGVLTAPIPGE